MTATADRQITIANEAQADAWNGAEGTHWATHAEHYERANRVFIDRLVASAVGVTDSVLDIGSGTGKSTRDAARRARQGSAVGVDLSAPMLAHARAQSRADGITNIDFLQADAQVQPFDEATFDVAISAFGTMFFDDPVVAFTNIGRALRPGGTIALMAFRDFANNEWMTALRAALALDRQLPEPPPDAPTPFAFADPDRVRAMLRAAGYEAITFTPIDAPMEFGSDADDAYEFLQGFGIVEGLTRGLSADQRTQALSQLRKTVEAHDSTEGVFFGASVWLITARRP
jgi:SAM-dependent methyltransferase